MVIDEAHNLSANWFKALASVPSSSLGLTIFWDANQLWSPSLKPGHHKGFNEKILDLQDALQSSLGCTPIELSVNYRNSREIADFFSAELSRALPQSIPSAVSAYSAGPVQVIHSVRRHEASSRVAAAVAIALKTYAPSEIAVVDLRGKRSRIQLAEDLSRGHADVTQRALDASGVLVADSETIKGHERKAVIVCIASRRQLAKKLGIAVKAYIAFSRACESLTVVELNG